MPHIPTEEEIRGFFKSLSNWGRWGADDQMGTLNLITPAHRLAAAKLVQEGVTVSCGRLMSKGWAPDLREPMQHYMEFSGDPWRDQPSEPGVMQAAADYLGMIIHGPGSSHVDALAHIFWDGKMYNGRPAGLVSTQHGATVGSVELARDGIVGRGVLLDIASAKGVKWLQPKEPIYPEDLEAAERFGGVQVQAGDIMLVRSGHYRRREEAGPINLADGRPGLHAACLPWLRQRDIALLGTDTATDIMPSGMKHPMMPVHQVGIVAMGLWLMDNANLERVAAACAQRRRYEFLLTIAPLRLHNFTGSPVNPIAMF
ncbi:MAG: cyclase family protein [Dehalococcoidia bacterium]|nr:cyclase family protein [Dehalococcoidia bacterium]